MADAGKTYSYRFRCKSTSEQKEIERLAAEHYERLKGGAEITDEEMSESFRRAFLSRAPCSRIMALLDLPDERLEWLSLAKNRQFMIKKVLALSGRRVARLNRNLDDPSCGLRGYLVSRAKEYTNEIKKKKAADKKASAAAIRQMRRAVAIQHDG